MNTKNNKRRQASQARIKRVFLERLQTRELSQITVSDICKEASINRSTFYANYLDIYDLADRIRDQLEDEVNSLYKNETDLIGNDYLKLFTHIKENQIFYLTYFKLGYDSTHTVDLGSISYQTDLPAEDLDYHVQFHKAGLNAVIKKWLAAGCDRAPEEMVRLIQDEYRYRS